MNTSIYYLPLAQLVQPQVLLVELEPLELLVELEPEFQ